MAFLGLASGFTNRVTLHIAITVMAPKNTTNLQNNQFNWDQKLQGIILGSFYCGYILTQMPGGILADRFGGKYVLGSGILISSLLTLLTAPVIALGGTNGLIALRTMKGLAQGVMYPSLGVLLSKWVPARHRARFGSFVYGGAQFGVIGGTFISGIILSHAEWDSVFYFFGVAGIIWFIFWICLCYNDPLSHPSINEQEMKYFKDNMCLQKTSKLKIPWKAMINTPPVWALFFAQLGIDVGELTVINHLPKYLTDVLEFDVMNTGIMATIPFLGMNISSFLFAWLCDVLIRTKRLRPANARKVFTTIAYIGAGTCMVCASYSHKPSEAVVLFTLALIFMGAYYPGMRVNYLDLTTHFPGTLTALINTPSSATGFLSPILIGYLTPNANSRQWRKVFWIMLMILILTNVIFVLWASGKKQWWDNISEESPSPKKSKKIRLNDNN